jgi:hypothetical protein
MPLAVVALLQAQAHNHATVFLLATITISKTNSRLQLLCHSQGLRT